MGSCFGLRMGAGSKLGDLFSKTHFADPEQLHMDNMKFGDSFLPPVVYAARRGLVQKGERAGQEGTTSLYFLHSVPEASKQFDQPIVTFVWMGGSYYNTRSDFPLHVGDLFDRAVDLLGDSLDRFRIYGRHPTKYWEMSSPGFKEYNASKPTDETERKFKASTDFYQPDCLLVCRFEGNLWVLIAATTIVGFVAGPMNDDPNDQAWRIVVEEYTSHTVKHRYPIGANALEIFYPSASVKVSDAARPRAPDSTRTAPAASTRPWAR